MSPFESRHPSLTRTTVDTRITILGQGSSRNRSLRRHLDQNGELSAGSDPGSREGEKKNDE